MFDFTVETEIERTPAEVFAYVTDATKLATWQTNTVSAVPETDGPLRVGSRIREVHRAPGSAGADGALRRAGSRRAR